jgi:anti-sigma factor ChrR (cupin superfamily)
MHATEILRQTAEIAWEEAKEYPQGGKMKVLREGSEREGRTILLRIEKGWEMAAHSHVTTEQHYILEGSYVSEGVVYSAGTYRLIPANANHGPFLTRTGATILVAWDPFPA